MTHITCRLTAKNRDQLRNPTLGNRVWATFTFFHWYETRAMIGLHGLRLQTESAHLSLDGELVHVLLLDLRPPRLTRLVQLGQSLGDARRPLARGVAVMTSRRRHRRRVHVTEDVIRRVTTTYARAKQGCYIFYAGASLAGAGYCRQCRRRPAILPLQLWQGCQVCVKISAQLLPRVAQFYAC